MFMNDSIEGLGGSAPFSEPETKPLGEFILSRDVAAVIFWEARATGGLVSAGGCGPQSDVSNPLAEIFGAAAGNKAANFEEDANQILNGDGSNWLDAQGIPAMAVLLPDYVTVDWENNLAGILAVLRANAN